MSWHNDMAILLAAASAAAPAGIRAFIGGGPTVAHDCHQVFVHPVTPHVVAIGNGGPQAGGQCVRIPEVTYQVVYVRDCYPIAEANGRAPSAAEVTAWTAQYMAAVEDIAGAVLAVADGDDAPGMPGQRLGGGDPCSVTIADGVFAGPLGRACSVSIPVRVSQS